MSEEIWKDIVGYEGLYQVSNMGRVRSYDRIYRFSNGASYHRKGRIMCQRRKPDGYMAITLYDNRGRRVVATVHPLVAKAFVPNPDNLPQVNHKDENKANNRADNLEWCTCKYNMNYGSRTKRASLAESIPVLQFSKDGDFIKAWASATEAYRKTGIYYSCISRCCRRRGKTAGGYRWRWKNDFDTIPPHLDDGYSPIRSTCKAVVQYTKSGDFVKEYAGANIAAKENHFDQPNISAACLGRKKYAYGYMWRYKEDIKEAS